MNDPLLIDLRESLGRGVVDPGKFVAESLEPRSRSVIDIT